MEAQPRLDASAPSSLRLASFALTAGGALLIGVGSLLTWVTVGINDQFSEPPTVTPGTDLIAGRVALVGAVVILVSVVMSRLVGSSARRVLAGVVILVGSLAALLAGWFVRAAPDHYSPVNDQTLVAAISAAMHRTPDQVRAALATVIDQLGGYTHIGPGPWLVIVGGALAIVGGVLTLRWAKATGATTPGVQEEASEPTPSMEPGA